MFLFLFLIFEHLCGAADGSVVRWCQPGIKNRWEWSGGAEERAISGQAREQERASVWPAGCFYNFLVCEILTSEKGLLLEEGSTIHSLSKLDIMEFKSFLHGRDEGVKM